MIILIDTSTPLCRLTFIKGTDRYDYEWQADRELAKGLLGQLDQQLQTHGWTWQDITGLGVFKGPGSFTGLRIGITVFNTLADSMSVPIVGETGDAWQSVAVQRLSQGENDKIVLPFYGSDARITTPRK